MSSSSDLVDKLEMLSMDNDTSLSKHMKALKINENKKTLVGIDLQPDDEHYVITCTGIDNNKDIYVKLRVKRKRET